MRVRLVGIVGCCSVFSMLMGGCHWLRHPDPYRGVRAEKKLVLPLGVVMRAGSDLYPVPDVPTKVTQWSSSDKYPIPPPLPLDVHRLHNQSSSLNGFQWVVGMTEDGNGYPLLSIGGAGFDQIWDELQHVLKLAHIPVVDLNRQLALVYLKASPEVTGTAKSAKKTEGSLLKLVQGVSAWQLSVEENADTLAPADFSRDILKKIQAAWPKTFPLKTHSAVPKPASSGK